MAAKPRPTITPVRIDPEAKPREIERIPLFYIGEKEYTIPAELSPNDALIALRMARTRGTVIAQSWMAEKGIGEEGMDDLIACDAITREQVKEILDNVQKMYLGDLEEMSGN